MTRNPLREPHDPRLARIAGPSALVMFGVTGDLAKKKLLPAVFDLANRGLLPPGFALVGFARRDWSLDEFRQMVHDSVRQHARTKFNEETWSQLAKGIRFVSGAFDDSDSFVKLRQTLSELDASRGTGGNYAFYLSVPPSSFPVVVSQLNQVGLARSEGPSWRRVVIEKPFGSNLKTAQELNSVVDTVFPPDAVFRIDHYLGKETVQNILAIRFANQMFEPIWNSEFVDHVQITMAEDIGVGSRAGYYDNIGAARDVIQNHLLQLMALTAMEPPKSFEAVDLQAAKENVLAATTLSGTVAESTARGQYVAGWQGGSYVKGFLDEDGMNPQSRTETYAALSLKVDTPRWTGVPFYLRAGKRLGRRVTEIALVFKRPATGPFTSSQTAAVDSNTLVIRVQPDEGVTIRFGSKVPGTNMQVRDVTMDFGYGHAFTEASPEAYERLILDVLLGDPPLFPRQEEVELSWKILDPVEEHWAAEGDPDPYSPGSWGPESAVELLSRNGHAWRRP